MITVEKARIEYFAAKEALNAIARSDDSTAAQRDDARSARDEITLEYIGKMVAAGDALTQQYQDFVLRMTQVIDELSSESTLASGLLKIQGLVDRSGKLLDPGHP